MKRPAGLIFIFLLALISLSFQGCYSPQKIMRLTPVDSDTEWYNGREVVTSKNKDALISLNCEGMRNGYHVMFLQYDNRSNRKFTFSPDDIYFETYKREKINGRDTLVKRFRMSAVDPELKIRSINESLNTLEARNDSRSSIELLGTLVEAASEISTAGKKLSPEEKERREKLHDERERRTFRAEEEYRNKKNEMNNEKDYWENSVMRKNTVYPGERLSGNIYMPVDNKAELIRVFIPADRDTCTIEFWQSEVKPLSMY